MALINITQVKNLFDEARLRYLIVQNFSYRPKREMDENCDDQMIVGFLRMYHQASNLLDKLTDLHTACTNLAAGDIQPYIDQHAREIGDEEPFDPFFEIEYNFDGESVYDLPETIETYAELHQMSLRFTQIREASDQALEKAFGGVVPFSLPVEEAGEIVIVKEKDLPKEFVEAINIERQIGNVETEHALDGYNQFYKACVESIRVNRISGTYQDCAIEILSLIRMK